MNAHLWLLALVAAVAIAGVAHLAHRRVRHTAPDSKTVCYTKHAKQRMAERGVSPAQIEAVLAGPERIMTDPVQGSVRLERTFGDRTLKVWVVAPWPNTSEIVVKTTAWKDPTIELRIPNRMIGRLIGPGGATINSIRSQTGAWITVDDQNGTVRISTPDRATAEAARQLILGLTTPPEQQARGSRAA